MKTIPRFTDIDCAAGELISNEGFNCAQRDATPEQLRDDGWVDGVPAISIDTWRQRDAERMTRLFETCEVAFRPVRQSPGLGRRGRCIARIGSRRVEFNSILAAARSVNGSDGAIHAAIKRGRPYRGFRWEFADKGVAA